MNAEEMRAFENNPNLAEIIKVRHYDDAGKRANIKTQQYAYYAPMIQRIVDLHCQGLTQ